MNCMWFVLSFMKKHSVLSLSWHRFFAGLFICFLVIPPPPVSGRFFGFCDGHLGEWLEGDKKKKKNENGRWGSNSGQGYGVNFKCILREHSTEASVGYDKQILKKLKNVTFLLYSLEYLKTTSIQIKWKLLFSHWTILFYLFIFDYTITQGLDHVNHTIEITITCLRIHQNTNLV